MNIFQSFRNQINNISCFQQTLGNEFQQAISRGDTALIIKLADHNKFLLSLPLPNGQLPLNFAIAQAQNESINTLLAKGVDVMLFDNDRLNALTTAYYKNDYRTIDQLLEHLIKDTSTEWKEEYKKNKEALKDIKGLNKFHYAAALHGKEIIKNAKERTFYLELKEGDSAQALAAQLDKKSPFFISKYDAAVFICSVVIELSQRFPALMIDPRIFQLVYYSPLLQNFDKTSLIVSMLSFAGMNASLFSEKLAPLSFGINMLLTVNLAYRTFQGLRSCWKNSSLSSTRALLKAAIVHAPKALLSFNQLRSIGEQFGLLNAPSKTQLQLLNERAFRCIKQNLEKDELSLVCMSNAYEDYTACSQAPDSEACQAAENSNEIFRFYQCRNDYTDYMSNRECITKLDKWHHSCSHNTDPETCQRAYKAFKSAATRNFAPDYNEDFWSTNLYISDPACPTENMDRMLNCHYQRKIWRNVCYTTLYSESGACTKGAAVFFNSLKKDPDYPDTWRSLALKTFNCKEILPQGYRLNFDSEIECEYKQKEWNTTCAEDPYSAACKTAETVFIDAIKNKFPPDYTSNFWQEMKNSTEYEEKLRKLNEFSEKFWKLFFGDNTVSKCTKAIEKITGSKEAILKDVRKMYHAQALELHPDIIPGHAEAMAELNGNYDIAKKCL